MSPLPGQRHMGGPFSAIPIQVIHKKLVLLFHTIADTGQRDRYAHICKQKIFRTEGYSIVDANPLHCRRFI